MRPPLAALLALVLSLAATSATLFASPPPPSSDFSVPLRRPPPARFLVIVGRERSGSTHLNIVLANSHPCVLNGNEALMNGKPEMDPLGIRHGTKGGNLPGGKSPDEWLESLGSEWRGLCPESCAQCTVLLKLFESSLGGGWEKQKAILGHPSVRVALLERAPSEQFCSLGTARASGGVDWSHTPNERKELTGLSPAEQADARRECLSGLPGKQAYHGFEADHNNFYNKVRIKLRHFGKTAVLIPFDASINCRLFWEVLPLLYTFAGHEIADIKVIDETVPLTCAETAPTTYAPPGPPPPQRLPPREDEETLETFEV